MKRSTTRKVKDKHMPKASEVAAELRNLADSLDKNPDLLVLRPWVYFQASTKEDFSATVKVMPKPLIKKIRGADDKWQKLVVAHVSPAIDLEVVIDRVKTCKIVTPAIPAVYECEPVLSVEEDAEFMEA
jgi:hypothetical protein